MVSLPLTVDSPTPTSQPLPVRLPPNGVIVSPPAGESLDQNNLTASLDLAETATAAADLPLTVETLANRGYVLLQTFDTLDLAGTVAKLVADVTDAVSAMTVSFATFEPMIGLAVKQGIRLAIKFVLKEATEAMSEARAKKNLSPWAAETRLVWQDQTLAAQLILNSSLTWRYCQQNDGWKAVIKMAWEYSVEDGAGQPKTVLSCRYGAEPPAQVAKSIMVIKFDFENQRWVQLKGAS